MDLNHTVVAMKGDKIAKVQCRTCKKEHSYKAPKGVSEPETEAKKHARAEAAATRKAERNAAGGSSVEVEWRKLMTAHQATPFKTYSAKTAFAIGDKIKHPTFGEGMITKLIHPNKIEVIFMRDIKILIHQPAVS